MPLDIAQLLSQHEGRNYELHAEHINPQFSKVLHTIGFDRCYVRAEGAYLWDEHGTKYLDTLAGYGVFNVGRNNPAIRDAIEQFLKCDYPSLVQMEAPLLSGLLAEQLKARVGAHLERVYFTSSGTEGVETAIKFARRATGRSGIAYLRKGFHGLTNGSLAINGDEIFREGFEGFLPDCHAISLGDLDGLEALLRGEAIAAFVVEPIQGKGVNVASDEFLTGAAELCQRYGTLFVADEVQSGMGRTGRFLALDHVPGVEPDIVVLSKALSGGYIPVGAVLTRRWIYDKVFSSLDRAVVHSSTFGQGSLAMVAGLATLNLMEEENLIERAAQMGDYLGERLAALQPRYEFMKDVRWRGLMIAIEFGEPERLGLKGAWRLAHKMDASLFPQAVTIPLLDDHHVLSQVAGHHIDVIKLLPPLVIERSDCDWFVSAFEDVMDRLHRFPGPVWEALSKIGKNALRARRQGALAAKAS
ncbi:MAG: aspartate aminotransferase family protein [Gammaproteobacteria bacterium]|nr:aspartate aminotransferase family protein [Gammaproteobacteria bacterium]